MEGRDDRRRNERYAQGASASSNSVARTEKDDTPGLRKQLNETARKKIMKKNVIRMEQLNMEDYRGLGETEEDRKRIQQLFERQAAARKNKHLDGVKMINEFVAPNRMTQWKVPSKVKTMREECVKQSYLMIDRLKERGKLDHIPIPPSMLKQAINRENNANKYQFAGLMTDDMKALTLEQLDEMTKKQNG